MEHAPIFGIRGRGSPLWGEFGMAPERRRLYRRVREVTHYGEDGRWCRYQVDFEKSIELRPEITPSDTTPPLEDRLLMTEELQELVGLLPKVLDHRERRVIHLRYYEDRTLEEIGMWLRLTKARILQIEQDALGKLARAMTFAETRAVTPH